MNIFELTKVYFSKLINIIDKAIELSHLKKTNLFLGMLFSLLFFSIILIFNIKTLMTGDDYAYSFIFTTGDRINNISDIIDSQYIHYYSWGGRSVVHSILQGLLMLPPLAIDLINTCVFIYFGFLCCFHIQGQVKFPKLSVILLVFLSTWIFQPAFANTILWTTGAVNYLWGATIILTFLLPYRIYKGYKKSIAQSGISSIILFFGGIIAGWTNENLSIAMIIMAILFVISYKSDKKKIPLWSILGIVGATIGFTLMIIAPGNFIRAEGTSNDLFSIIYRILTYTQAFVNYTCVINIILSIFLILYTRYKLKDAAIFNTCLIYAVGIFISIYSMVLSPSFPARAWFGTITLNIILLGIVLVNLNYTQDFVKNIKAALLSGALVYFGFSVYDAYNDINDIYKIRIDREIAISQKEQEGANAITFKQFHEKTKFGLGDAPYAKEYMSKYYGIEFELE